MGERQLNIYEAITDILKVFIASEIGTDVEFDNKAISNYIDSFTCSVHFWDAKTKEDVYEQFTNDILNGYPVWRMVKLSEWTMKMVEQSFQSECDEAMERAKKKLKCLTCKYYSETQTQLGVIRKCSHERCCVNTHPIERSKGVLAELRQVCKLYSRAEKTTGGNDNG